MKNKRTGVIEKTNDITVKSRLEQAFKDEITKLSVEFEHKLAEAEMNFKAILAEIFGQQKRKSFKEFIGIDASTAYDNPQVFEAATIFENVYAYHDLGTDLGRFHYADSIPFQERFDRLTVPTFNDWDNPLYNFYDRYSKWKHVKKLVIGIQTFQPTKGTLENPVWKTWPNQQLSAVQWGGNDQAIRSNAKKYFSTLIRMFEGTDTLPKLHFDEIVICVFQEGWGDPGKQAIQQIYLGAGDAWKEIYPDGNNNIKFCSGAMQAWEPLGKSNYGDRLHDFVEIIPNIEQLDYLNTHPYGFLDGTFKLSGLPEGANNEHRHFPKMLKYNKPVIITEDGYNFDGLEKFYKQFRAAIKAYNDGAQLYCIYDLVQNEADKDVFHNTGLTKIKDGKLIKSEAWYAWKSILDNFGNLEVPRIKDEGDNFTWVVSDDGRKEYNFAWTHNDEAYFHPIAGKLTGDVKQWES